MMMSLAEKHASFCFYFHDNTLNEIINHYFIFMVRMHHSIVNTETQHSL